MDTVTLVARALRTWSEEPALPVERLRSSLQVSRPQLDRAFWRAAGLAPKQLQQVLAVERARPLVERLPALEAALTAGMSGPGRLHDRCVRVEALTPGELRAQGRDLVLRWGVADTLLGPASVCWSGRGIHRLVFSRTAAGQLTRHCPQARLVRDDAAARALLGEVFAPAALRPLRIQALGTPFQIAVWRALLTIPPGATTTYQALAQAIGRPRAARAVGAACGENPVAWLIPCHRVLAASGALGGYRWGLPRKASLLWHEATAATISPRA